MSQLFGYSLDRKKGSKSAPSFVRKESDDAAQPIVAGGYFGQYVEMGDAANKASEADLIGRYREMSLHPECDAAINDGAAAIAARTKVRNRAAVGRRTTITDATFCNVTSAGSYGTRTIGHRA